MTNKIAIIIVIVLFSCSEYESSDTERWKSLISKYFEYDKRGQYDSALHVSELALVLAIKSFEKNDMRIADSHNNVGEMLRELGKFDEAIKNYQIAIKISEANNDSVGRITFYNNIGILYSKSERLDLAKSFSERSIQIIEKLYSDTDNRLITPLLTLGLVEIENNNLQGAHESFKRALHVSNKNSDNPNHVILGNLGHIQMMKRNFDSAFYYFNDARILRERIYGENHPQMADLYSKMGVYYHVIQEYDSAIKYYRSSIESRPVQNGRINPGTYQSKYNLGRLYNEIGDFAKGDSLLNEASKLKSGK